MHLNTNAQDQAKDGDLLIWLIENLNDSVQLNNNIASNTFS